MKLTVGGINIGRAGLAFSTGSTMVAAGGPLAALGALKAGLFAPSLFKRGVQQVSEAVHQEGFSDASLKNLAGLLPAGQKFDDPGEPNVIEYAQKLADKIPEDKALAFTQLLDDYLLRTTQSDGGS